MDRARAQLVISVLSFLFVLLCSGLINQLQLPTKLIPKSIACGVLEISPINSCVIWRKVWIVNRGENTHSRLWSLGAARTRNMKGLVSATFVLLLMLRLSPYARYCYNSYSFICITIGVYVTNTFLSTFWTTENKRVSYPRPNNKKNVSKLNFSSYFTASFTFCLCSFFPISYIIT